MKRLFLENNGYEEKIFAFNDSDIQKEYNVNGLFYKDEDFKKNLKEYKEARNQYVRECLDYDPEQSIKEILEEFQEDFNYTDSRSRLRYGRPSLFVEYDDDDNVLEPEKFYWDDFTPVNLKRDELEFFEFYEYWDGSNWVKKYLSQEAAGIEIEEITDEKLLKSFNNKEFVTDNKQQNSTHYNDYCYDKEARILWIKKVSLYQGSLDYWEFVENEDIIAKVFIKYLDEDIIKDLASWIIQEHGENLILIENSQYMDVVENLDGPENLAQTEIANKDDFVEIGEIDNGTHGTIFFEYKGKIVEYKWSAYQGDRNFYCYSDLTKEEILEKY